MLTDSTRSVRPCKAKESFVVCELPPLVAGTAVPGSCCGERRVLRRLAESDGSQGASADYEVAVGQQQERKSFGRRDEPEPGPTAGSGVESTRSSSLKRKLRASAGVRGVRRTRSDCRVVGRGRPTVDCVRRAVTRSVIEQSSREENQVRVRPPVYIPRYSTVVCMCFCVECVLWGGY